LQLQASFDSHRMLLQPCGAFASSSFGLKLTFGAKRGSPSISWHSPGSASSLWVVGRGRQLAWAKSVWPAGFAKREHSSDPQYTSRRERFFVSRLADMDIGEYDLVSELDSPGVPVCLLMKFFLGRLLMKLLLACLEAFMFLLMRGGSSFSSSLFRPQRMIAIAPYKHAITC